MTKENKGKKFDICLMNPPFGGTTGLDNAIDIRFIQKVNGICKKSIIISTNRLISNRKTIKNMYNQKHIYDIELIDAQTAFGISPFGFKHITIQSFDNEHQYNTSYISINGNNKEKIDITLFENRDLYLRNINYSKDILNIINKKTILYKTLLNKFHSMCNDNEQFIYEENKGGLYGIKKKEQKHLSRVKKYLKDGIYKYCLYKGSGNHNYDNLNIWNGEDPDKLFNGQICWLTNKKNIKNNIKYWMECPLFDLWRIYYFNFCKFAACWSYTKLPALNFDQDETKFKSYVDKLNDFTKEEIKTLKENNIHNADKLH